MKTPSANPDRFSPVYQAKSSSAIDSPSSNTIGSQILPVAKRHIVSLPPSPLSASISDHPQSTTIRDKDISTPSKLLSGSQKKETTISQIAPTKRITTKFTPLKIALPTLAKQNSIPIEPVKTCEKPLEFPRDTPINEIRDTLKTSFLERLYRANKTSAGCSTQISAEDSFDGLSSRLFDGPHSSATINTAIRFIIARIHTTFQLGDFRDPVSSDPVIACHEFCKDISVVFTHNGGTDPTSSASTLPKARGRVRRTIGSDTVPQAPPPKEPKLTAYLVISETGDVVARSDKFQMKDLLLPVDLSKFALRADWTAYIETAQTKRSLGQTEEGLINHVKTKQSEDYPNGIAAVWRGRMAGKGNTEEILVAERYVLGNVVLNR
jgi:hypothetical protein